MRGRDALLVTPDAQSRRVPWILAAAAGRLPVLVIAPSDRNLAERARALTERCDLVTCHLRADMTDEAVGTMREQFASGRWDAAFVSARSLGDPRLKSAAQSLDTGLLVIEQAQRVSVRDSRHDPAWLEAASLAQRATSVLALSDVASPETRHDISSALGLSDCRVELVGLDRRDLRIEMHRAESTRKQSALLLGLLEDAPERMVVYVSQRVEAERIAALIRDERGFDALDITNVSGSEFAAALRRFREGSLRVVVTTGALDLDSDHPPIPVTATAGLPESLELLHRQLHVASGPDARAAVIYGPDEQARLQRRALQTGFDAGHLLSVYRAVGDGKRMSHFELSRRSGMHPDDVAAGLAILIREGAVAPKARGDDWVQVRPEGALSGEALERWDLHVDSVRRARLQQAEQVLEFARSRRCRRRALAEVLGYPLIDTDCTCDRCRPRTPVEVPVRMSTGYPIETEDCRGWALALYRRPGEDEPTEGAAKLLHALKYEGCEASGRRLAALMYQRVRKSRTYRGCEVIVPIPPSARGADDAPAVALARENGRLAEVPVAAALMSADAPDRRPQKELSSLSEKERNIAHAFDVTDREAIADRSVLLVDDIFDSGATLQEAAHTLKRAGAADIRLLTAVRTSFGWRRDV